MSDFDIRNVQHGRYLILGDGEMGNLSVLEIADSLRMAIKLWYDAVQNHLGPAFIAKVISPEALLLKEANDEED